MKELILTIATVLSLNTNAAIPTKAPQVETPPAIVFQDCIDEEPVYYDFVETIFEEEEKNETFAYFSAEELKYHGRLNWNDSYWTWYSEKVLPGTGLNIPGRMADENGFICDEDGYICLASSVLDKGTIVGTPFGKEGKIYDCGCREDTFDVYVNW